MNSGLNGRTLVIRVLAAAGILLLIMAVCSLIGSHNIFSSSPQTSADNTAVNREIYFHIRLPRILMAAIVGAALACAGTVLQAILRNPLADPYLLGISSGAGLGIMLAVVAGFTWTLGGISPIATTSFVCALLTVWAVWVLGGGGKHAGMTGLLLAGVVINAFLSAVIMLLTSVAKASEVQTTLFWLMGNFMVLDNFAILWICAGIVLSGVLILFCFSPALNLLSFSPEEAQASGVNVKLLYQSCFAISALITAVAVSLSGLVGFVGLIIPHAVRLIIGPDHRQLVPISALAGAAFVVVADTVSRIVVAPAVMPVGVVTAMAGGPFFLFLLVRQGKKIYGEGR